MQLIRACWWAAEKPGEKPSRPNGAWPGLRNTTSSAIKPSKQTRSPALTAWIQVACTSRIARSSGPICNPRLRTTTLTCRGRLQDLHAARNQDGGPGQLHPLVMHCFQPTHLTVERRAFVERLLRGHCCLRPRRPRAFAPDVRLHAD